MIAPANNPIQLSPEKLASFCRRWGISRLELFGSGLRRDFNAASDLDFLFTPGTRFPRDQAYGPWGRNRMADELAQITGRTVDLVERRSVEQHRNWIRRRHILESARTLYVEG